VSKEFNKRIITSVVLIGILLNCLFINNYLWLFLLTITSLISCYEFFNLSKKFLKNNFLLTLTTILSFTYLSFFTYVSYEITISYGKILFLFILLTCIFSDIGGYVIGKGIGGKKLTKISPNKTISGTLGSFLFSIFPIGIYNLIYTTTSNDLFKFVTEGEIFIVCLSISFVSQLGDLLISYFKRLALVKDTSNILPGHGGILDRIDGMIFVIPFVYIVEFLL